MTSVFADTFYWVALAQPADQHHSQAVALPEHLGSRPLATTDEVLTEVLAYFSRFGPGVRKAAAGMVRTIMADPGVTTVAQSRPSFLSALDLYERRLDKGYSLVDCASMVAMREMGIHEVLTNDVHFEQEGFRALFRA